MDDKTAFLFYGLGSIILIPFIFAYVVLPLMLKFNKKLVEWVARVSIKIEINTLERRLKQINFQLSLEGNKGKLYSNLYRRKKRIEDEMEDLRHSMPPASFS